MLRTVLSAVALIAITACGVAAEQSQPAPQPAPAVAPAAQPAAPTSAAPAADPAAAATPAAETPAPAAAEQEEEIKFFNNTGRLPRCPGDPRCPRGDGGVAPRANQGPSSGGGG